MDKKEIKKRKRKRNRLIKSLVLVVAFVIAIGATFGVTMAYFGGKSDKANYNMMLKMGLFVGVPTSATNTASTYVVPSQIVTANCEFTVKSAASTSTSAPASDTSDPAKSDGLIRAKIEFDSSEIEDVTISLDDTYFPVSIVDGTGKKTSIGNFVYRATSQESETDGYYYLITGTTMSHDAAMYVIQSSKGEQKFTFDLRVSIPDELTNDHAGKPITLSVTYEVIQADFYDKKAITNDNPTGKMATNVENAFNVFSDTSLVGKDAGYTYGS